VTALSAIAGCVALPPNSARSPQDPWESWNHGFYKFNDKLDRAAAKPVARMYVKKSRNYRCPAQ
jgi:ABC-type transporter lipoprotein component MlaA